MKPQAKSYKEARSVILVLDPMDAVLVRSACAMWAAGSENTANAEHSQAVADALGRALGAGKKSLARWNSHYNGACGELDCTTIRSME